MGQSVLNGGEAQDRIIAMTLEGRTTEYIAKALGIHRKGISRLAKRDPNFRAALELAREKARIRRTGTRDVADIAAKLETPSKWWKGERPTADEYMAYLGMVASNVSDPARELAIKSLGELLRTEMRETMWPVPGLRGPGHDAPAPAAADPQDAEVPRGLQVVALPDDGSTSWAGWDQVQPELEPEDDLPDLPDAPEAATG